MRLKDLNSSLSSARGMHEEEEKKEEEESDMLEAIEKTPLKADVVHDASSSYIPALYI